MKINESDVNHVANLARLELAEDEKAKFASQIESILDYVSQLSKPDTGNVPPTSHVLALKNVWRKDEARKTSDENIEKLLANAPEREDNFFKVKKVIE